MCNHCYLILSYFFFNLSRKVFAHDIHDVSGDVTETRRCCGPLYLRPGVDLEDMTQQAILFAAGTITGEALLGILLAVPIVITGDVDVMSVVSAEHRSDAGGICMLVFTLVALVWVPTRSLFTISSRTGYS